MDNAKQPVAGLDYPQSFPEFDRFFPDEAACRAYLERLRWPDGFACPRCRASVGAWTTSRGYLHCRACGGETSITGGTLFEGTRTPLRSWFMAMWFVTSQKYGASALGLKRVLGLGSYQTAWTWLHKLRRAMVRPDRQPLRGVVEVDETYVGGVSRGIRGRGAKGKTAVAIALELREPKGFGRVRMHRVADCSGPTLTKFVCENVATGSVIRTDGWPSYNGISAHGYKHEPTATKSADPEEVFMPGVHRVASLLKRVLLGTHQGAVAGAHLDYYLDEFTFRFNRRASRSRGLLFYRLAEQAVCTPPTSYRRLVGGADLSADPSTTTGRGSLAPSG